MAPRALAALRPSEAATSDFVPLVGNFASHFLSFFFYSHALLRGPLSWG